MKIKEIIVVEGKNDTNVLQSCIDCDTIETHGTHLSVETLRLIEQAAKTRGVIIFTDPDHPGEIIRTAINQKIPGCKNAYIEKHKAKTAKKVGVEHASKKDLLDALSHVFTYQVQPVESISWEEYLSLGLHGGKAAAHQREKVAQALYLGRPNAKTLFKRLNMMQLTLHDVEELLRK